MSVTPPEAKPEYSRAPRQSKLPAAIPLAVLAGGLAGALLLLVAEFTPLYKEDSAASTIALKTAQTGAHHAYALIPIALLAIVLAFGASRTASRPALLALGALGIVTIVIALAVDLPDAHASGIVQHRVSSAQVGFAQAKDVPQIGLYLETLGAALLVITCGAGLLLMGSRGGRAPAAAAPPRSAS
jgi:hypothetical protein